MKTNLKYGVSTVVLMKMQIMVIKIKRDDEGLYKPN